jgi:hypothetical protein
VCASRKTAPYLQARTASKVPTLAHEHDCEHYHYKKDQFKPNHFQHCAHDYCNNCAFELDGFCSGKNWIPYKTEPKCEFYRDKNKTCVNAVPIHQEGCGPDLFRNNYCRLPPEQRDGEQSSGWKHMCYQAHTKGAEYKKCYAVASTENTESDSNERN